MAGELIETFSNSEVRVIFCFVNFWLIFMRDNQIALDFRAVFTKLPRLIIQIYLLNHKVSLHLINNCAGRERNENGGRWRTVCSDKRLCVFLHREEKSQCDGLDTLVGQLFSIL